jgi:hypothetical protein
MSSGRAICNVHLALLDLCSPSPLLYSLSICYFCALCIPRSFSLFRLTHPATIAPTLIPTSSAAPTLSIPPFAGRPTFHPHPFRRSPACLPSGGAPTRCIPTVGCSSHPLPPRFVSQICGGVLSSRKWPTPTTRIRFLFIFEALGDLCSLWRSQLKYTMFGYKV